MIYYLYEERRTTMKELKKCPLCGNTPKTLIYSDQNYNRGIRFVISCDCGLELSSRLYSSLKFEEMVNEIESIIERWNNRK